MSILDKLNDRLRLLTGAPPLMTRERLIAALHKAAADIDRELAKVKQRTHRPPMRQP